MVFGKMAPTYKNITSQDSRNHMSTHILNIFCKYFNVIKEVEVERGIY
jgi:hypothetical protein